MTRDHCGRKDKRIQERRHDTYQAEDKRAAVCICPCCSAVYSNGRWAWKKPGSEADEVTCPACRRIADNFPAGSIEIKGQFFPEHRHEVLSLIRNIEKLENGERPLERIISIEDQEHGIVLTTTGIHIARRIGEALSRSYKGHFSFKYLDAQKSIRVQWER